ncbi:MAG TPA: VWA domain-containing protein [Gemmataceae bacterium]|nr:VWA domain-containing protein [Gemmataceae bacterium]
MMSLDRAFAHPWVLWFLMVPPVLSLLALLSRYWHRQSLIHFGRIPALTALTSRGPLLRFLQASCRTIGVTLLVLACAGPQWGRQPVTATALGRDLIVVLDMSRSMLADDVVGSAAPNRLGRAQDGLQQLADVAQKRGGYRLALVVFASRAKVACPLTHDYDHFRDALASLDPDDPGIAPAIGSEPPSSGTRIGAALATAAELGDTQDQGYQDILLISDGDDPAQDQEWTKGIAAARDHQVPVYTVGVGDPAQGGRIPVGQGYLFHNGKEVRTRLQERPLEAIAARTGGSYTAARTGPLLLGKLLVDQIEPRGGREQQDEAIMPYVQHSAWFFAGAIVFLSLELLSRPAGRRRRHPRRLLNPVIEARV